MSNDKAAGSRGRLDSGASKSSALSPLSPLSQGSGIKLSHKPSPLHLDSAAGHSDDTKGSAGELSVGQSHHSHGPTDGHSHIRRGSQGPGSAREGLPPRGASLRSVDFLPPDVTIEERALLLGVLSQHRESFRHAGPSKGPGSRSRRRSSRRGPFSSVRMLSVDTCSETSFDSEDEEDEDEKGEGLNANGHSKAKAGGTAGPEVTRRTQSDVAMARRALLNSKSHLRPLTTIPGSPSTAHPAAANFFSSQRSPVSAASAPASAVTRAASTPVMPSQRGAAMSLAPAQPRSKSKRLKLVTAALATAHLRSVLQGPTTSLLLAALRWVAGLLASLAMAAFIAYPLIWMTTETDIDVWLPGLGSAAGCVGVLVLHIVAARSCCRRRKVITEQDGVPCTPRLARPSEEEVEVGGSGGAGGGGGSSEAGEEGKQSLLTQLRWAFDGHLYEGYQLLVTLLGVSHYMYYLYHVNLEHAGEGVEYALQFTAVGYRRFFERELVLVVSIALDVVLRIALSKRRWHTFLSLASLMECLSFFAVAYYLPLGSAGINSFTVYSVYLFSGPLRILRLRRAVKSLDNRRAGRDFSMGPLIISGAMAEVLVVATRVALYLFTFAAIVVLVEFPCEHIVEHPETCRPDLRQFHQSVYFCVVAISTVGFGDLYPATTLGRMTVMIMLVVGLIQVPVQVNELVTYFQEEESDMDRLYHVLLNTQHDVRDLRTRLGLPASAPSRQDMAWLARRLAKLVEPDDLITASKRLQRRKGAGKRRRRSIVQPNLTMAFSAASVHSAQRLAHAAETVTAGLLGKTVAMVTSEMDKGWLHRRLERYATTRALRATCQAIGLHFTDRQRAVEGIVKVLTSAGRSEHSASMPTLGGSGNLDLRQSVNGVMAPSVDASAFTSAFAGSPGTSRAFVMPLAADVAGAGQPPALVRKLSQLSQRFKGSGRIHP